MNKASNYTQIIPAASDTWALIEPPDQAPEIRRVVAWAFNAEASGEALVAMESGYTFSTTELSNDDYCVSVYVGDLATAQEDLEVAARSFLTMEALIRMSDAKASEANQ